MPITTNESPSFGSPGSSGGAENSRSGGVAGIEIPVIVHASRYSTSSTSVGKSLPPVHEETTTVIIFDQGAVVRLTAAMIAGEVVVLTNKLSGADVICKVANVKAQPGTQNYVSLEFTQRAPRFWGESPQSANSTPAAALPAPVAAPPSMAPRIAEPAPSSQPAQVAPVAALPAPPVIEKPPVVETASFETTPIASIATEPIAVASTPPVAPSAAPSRKAFGAGSTLGLGLSSAAPSNLRPIEFASVSSRSGSSGSKNLALIGVAAVVLLALGGVGGWLLLRPGQPAIPVAEATRELPAVQPAPEPEASGVASAPVEPTAESSSTNKLPSAVQAGVQPAVAKSASEPVVEASSSIPASPAAPSGAVKSAEPIVEPPVTRRPAAIGVTKMVAPSVKKRAATSGSSEAPPELLAQPAAIAGNSLNDNLLASSVRNSGPVAPAPVAPARGGQLVQPKLISTISPAYPPQARAAHAQGDVIIDAFINETGKVGATKVISGPPMLQQAAMAAVRSWMYQPARLNGEPISIHIRVTVSFHLQ